MDITIRRGGRPDFATALALIERTLGDLVDPPKKMRHPDIYPMGEDDILLIAEAEGVPMGMPMGMLYGHAGRADGLAGHLTLLAVDAEHRHQGIGRTLIREYALIAEQAGTAVVWLDVPDGHSEQEQRGLLRYYERQGWADRTGYLAGRTNHRREQMYGTPQTILAAVGR